MPLKKRPKPASTISSVLSGEAVVQDQLAPGEISDSLIPYYKTIFDCSSDGISVTDHQGRLLMVNQASAENLGVSKEELQFKHVNYLTDNNLASGTVTLDVLRTRQTVTKLVQQFRSGRQILLTGRPILGPDGQVRLVVINERDLTLLMELETSLKRQKRITARFKDELEALRLTELAGQEIVAKSPAMSRTLDTALKLASHGVKQILITGESGTGKGFLAKFIHAHSPNASEPFIHINCAALPETLLEAELFGYDAGAFTGAAPEGRAGLFEAAGRGTAFLDEIGEMPLGLQAKLLTFLDNREFRRLSGRQIIPAPCTVIAATNCDLEQLAAQKKFRQDLYWRLSVFCLHLPPLRERLEDLLELTRREVDRLNAHYGLKRELDAQTLKIIQKYPFPGNVRELLNRLQQAALLSEGPSLAPFLQRSLAEGEGEEAFLKAAAPAPPSPAAGLYEEVAQAEKQNLMEALKTCASTREMAARLGISQASVSRKLRKYGLNSPQPRSGRPAKAASGRG